MITLQALEQRQYFSSPTPHHRVAPPPRYDHVVIVVEENKDRGDVLSPTAGLGPSMLWPYVSPPPLKLASFVNSLATHGADMTNAHGETHPSQPNYMAMFSGSTQGVTNDVPPKTPLAATSLAGQLLSAGLTFKSYAEDLPAIGSRVDKSKNYYRKHNPAASFADVLPQDNVPFNQFPQTARGFRHLPTVSMVIPNQINDMHSGSIRRGDQWLRHNIGRYARWASAHDSLLVVTWDEGSGGNHVPTVLFGAHVKRAKSSQHIDHFSLLRTIEDIYALSPLGQAQTATPIREIFSSQSV